MKSWHQLVASHTLGKRLNGSQKTRLVGLSYPKLSNYQSGNVNSFPKQTSILTAKDCWSTFLRVHLETDPNDAYNVGGIVAIAKLSFRHLSLPDSKANGKSSQDLLTWRQTSLNQWKENATTTQQQLKITATILKIENKKFKEYNKQLGCF